MKISKNKTKSLGILLALVSLFFFMMIVLLSSVHAQSFPEQPINVIEPNANPYFDTLYEYKTTFTRHESNSFIDPSENTQTNNENEQGSGDFFVKTYSQPVIGREGMQYRSVLYWDGTGSFSTNYKIYDSTTDDYKESTKCDTLGCNTDYQEVHPSGEISSGTYSKSPSYSIQINPEVKNNTDKVIVNSYYPWIGCNEFGNNKGEEGYESTAICTDKNLTIDFTKIGSCEDAYDSDNPDRTYSASATQTSKLIFNRTGPISLSASVVYPDPEYVRQVEQSQQSTVDPSLLVPFEDIYCDVHITRNQNYLDQEVCGKNSLTIPLIRGQIKVFNEQRYKLWIASGGEETPNLKNEERFWTVVADGEFKDSGKLDENNQSIYTMVLKADNSDTRSWIYDEGKLYLATHGGFITGSRSGSLAGESGMIGDDAPPYQASQARCFAYLEDKPQVNISSDFILNPFRDKLICNNDFCIQHDFTGSSSISAQDLSTLEMGLMLIPGEKVATTVAKPFFGAIKNAVGRAYVSFLRICPGMKSCKFFIYTTGKKGAPAIYADINNEYFQNFIKSIRKDALARSGGDPKKFIEELGKIMHDLPKPGKELIEDSLGELGDSEVCKNDLMFAVAKANGNYYVPLSQIAKEGNMVCREISMTAACVLKEQGIQSKVVSGICTRSEGHAWLEIPSMNLLFDPSLNIVTSLDSYFAKGVYSKAKMRSVFQP